MYRLIGQAVSVKSAMGSGFKVSNGLVSSLCSNALSSPGASRFFLFNLCFKSLIIPLFPWYYTRELVLSRYTFPMKDIQVTALWDDEAKVWVAESEQVPGLVAEAETVEGLLSKLEHLIPELLELNQGKAAGVVPITLKAERQLRYAL